MTENMRPITAYDADLVIEKFFSYLSPGSKFVDTLKELINDYTVCLVGGSIRDIVNHTQPRDFDLIIDTDNENLRHHFSEFTTKYNRFGGLKCVINEYAIDIWSFNDNWAFRTGLLDKNVENIPRGAFYNIDALSIDLSKRKIYSEYYNRCVHSKTLDFVSHDPKYVSSNPAPAQNVLKSFYVWHKYDLELSEEVISYIEHWINSNDDYIKDILKAEIHHFGSVIYKDDEVYNFLLKKLRYIRNKYVHLKY